MFARTSFAVVVLLEASALAQPVGPRVTAGSVADARQALQSATSRATTPPERLEELGLRYLEACSACATLDECEADRLQVLAGKARGEGPCFPADKGRKLLEEGQALAAKHRYQEATTPLLRAAIAGASEAHLHLGHCFARLGQHANAAWHYEEFVHLSPQSPHAGKVRETLRASFTAGQAVPRYPELAIVPPLPAGPQAFQDGKELLREKKYRESIPRFLSAAEQGVVEAQLYLGIAYANSGDTARGAWHYEEFVHLAPGHKSAPQAVEILRQYFANTPQAKPRYPLPQ